MATPAQRVVARAEKTFGIHEIPWGSNDDGGGWITRIQEVWGLRRQPWCNMATAAWFKESGVDDDGIQSPATWITAQNAHRKGYVTSAPSVGSLICWPGKHIGLVRQVFTSSIVGTIEGNSSDQVQHRVRDAKESGAIFITVPAILQSAVRPPDPIQIYCFEDLKGPRLHPGKWRTKLFAKRAKRKLGGLGRQVKLTKRDKRWRLLLPREYRYNQKAGRDAWAVKFEKTYGYGVRKTTRMLYPKSAKQAVADGLGKTT